MSSPIDIIKAANRKDPIRTEIELPGGIKCWMHLPNKHSIADVREKLYRMAYAEAAEIGLVGKPINQAEWKTYIEALKNNKNKKKESIEKEVEEAEKDKPNDLAEQFAIAQSMGQIIYNLLPGLIRDDLGVEIFPTLSEKREFLAIVRDDAALEKTLISKWNELFKTQREVAQEAKNS